MERYEQPLDGMIYTIDEVRALIIETYLQDAERDTQSVELDTTVGWFIGCANRAIKELRAELRSKGN